MLLPSPPPADCLMQTPINALPISRDLKLSTYPLDALYNTTINTFKTQEKRGELPPSPLTLMAVADGIHNKHHYLYYNDERGIKLEYKPSSL